MANYKLLYELGLLPQWKICPNKVKTLICKLHQHTFAKNAISHQNNSTKIRVNNTKLNIKHIDNLLTLTESVKSCTMCELYKTRNNVVFGSGFPNADWLFVGESPGETEDRNGKPFVGQAGKLLDNMLRAINIRRSSNKIYITNVIKCRPPNNRNPKTEEISTCLPYLQQQIKLVKPKIIIALGRFAAHTLLKCNSNINILRQQEHKYCNHIPVVVTYHPAYLLRKLQDKAKAWSDLQFAYNIYRKIIK